MLGVVSPSGGKTVSLHHHDFKGDVRRDLFKAIIWPKKKCIPFFHPKCSVIAKPYLVCEVSLVLHWSCKANVATKHGKFIARVRIVEPVDCGTGFTSTVS